MTLKKISLKKHHLKFSFKKTILTTSGLLGIFLIVNVVMLFIFSTKTYPNTQLNDLKVGSLNYSKLDQKLTTNPVIPQQIVLIENGSKVTMDTSELGVKENLPIITKQLESHSWLPVANLFQKHNANVALSINYPQLNKQLAVIAAKYNKSPENATINLAAGTFSVNGNSNGYSLNSKLASSSIVDGIQNNKLAVALPVINTASAITTSSLESNLKSLQSQQALSISYIYDGKVVKASPSDIASWFSLSGSSYAINLTAVQSYIKNVGNSDNIAVNNLSNAVSATQSALTKLEPLSFTLTAIPNTVCSSNSISQLILVSVSQQHLWACSSSSEVYDSAVVTGDEQNADTLTPVGTYHIYAKQTDKTLKGSDENGSWSDFVSYWMPFLYNQYGAYGLHDATWRSASDFGNTNINTSAASNGCVELPLVTAQWLYSWDEVGTTVKIEN